MKLPFSGLRWPRGLAWHQYTSPCRGSGSLRNSCSNSGLRPGSGLTRNLRFPSQTASPALRLVTEAPNTPQHCCSERDTQHKAAAVREPRGAGQGRGGAGETLAPCTERNLEETQGDDKEREQVPASPRGSMPAWAPAHGEALRWYAHA